LIAKLLSNNSAKKTEIRQRLLLQAQPHQWGSKARV